MGTSYLEGKQSVNRVSKDIHIQHGHPRKVQLPDLLPSLAEECRKSVAAAT